MEFGSDYYDLATFYWETGDRDKAVKIADAVYEALAMAEALDEIDDEDEDDEFLK
jgi:hypothetical protein